MVGIWPLPVLAPIHMLCRALSSVWVASHSLV